MIDFYIYSEANNTQKRYDLTANLIPMAKAIELEFGTLYDYIFIPREFGYTKAIEFILPLQSALKELKAHDQKYRKMNPKQGLGSYGVLVKFVENVLKACKEDEEAIIGING